jgi:hypothetical protein
MARTEYFRTIEGTFRILVQQEIDGIAVDWFLIERSRIQAQDKLVAHEEAVKQFVGQDVEYLISSTNGYVFQVKK